MNLQNLFNPTSIAIIGASRDPKSAGHGILKNLIQGCVMKCSYCIPFPGKVFAINPHAKKILGVTCHSSILDIKDLIDLAIIVVPSRIVEDQVDLCIAKKVKSVIIISAGFSEIGENGKQLQERIVLKLRRAGITLLGPNCLGIIRTSTHLNASFAPSMPPNGSIAFISQSGALADSIIDWAIQERYGFSSIVSIGNSAATDIADFIEYFSKDPETKVITLYIEGITDGRKFMRIAKKASLKKPIIAIKAGKTSKGRKAIASHTGSLAGNYEVFTTAFRQSNVLVAESVEEMFDLAKAFATQPLPEKNSIAILTNGGGPGVLCADYCTEFGVHLAELDHSTIKELERSPFMHPAFSKSNPLDIVGDALSDRYRVALNILLSKEYISGVIVIQTLQTMTETKENSQVIVEAKHRFPNKPILCTYVGGKFSKTSISYLEEHRIPDFNDVRKSAKVMSALVKRKEQLSFS